MRIVATEMLQLRRGLRVTESAHLRSPPIRQSDSNRSITARKFKGSLNVRFSF